MFILDLIFVWIHTIKHLFSERLFKKKSPIVIENALDFFLEKPKFKMFYKVFTKKTDDFHDILIFAYFNNEDITHVFINGWCNAMNGYIYLDILLNH